jgi:beta-N-acetylhexosaminidase
LNETARAPPNLVMKTFLGAALVASLLCGAGPSAASVSASARPTLAQLVGQKLIVRMEGVTPSADLLGRIRRGEVGGVLLFSSNLTTPAALVALTAQLHAAATGAGQPALLIAVDQEGGSVKRIPWAPPGLSAPQLGRLGSASVAREQGASTGAALNALGIDVDFAPVADVPASTSSFMYREGRTFSFNASRTALLTDAFARGLESGGVVATMKHFPGLGFATRNTDSAVVTIAASRAALAPGLLPYRTAIRHGVPLIMLSNATYSAYDARNGAGWSWTIINGLLRRDLGFTGVTITDSLDGTAKARGIWTRVLAISAARGGADMILTTGDEASTRRVYATLLLKAQLGTIPRATLEASYERILALKAGL